MEGSCSAGVFLCVLGCVVIDIKAIREVVEGVLAGGRALGGRRRVHWHGVGSVRALRIACGINSKIAPGKRTPSTHTHVSPLHESETQNPASGSMCFTFFSWLALGTTRRRWIYGWKQQKEAAAHALLLISPREILIWWPKTKRIMASYFESKHTQKEAFLSLSWFLRRWHLQSHHVQIFSEDAQLIYSFQLLGWFKKHQEAHLRGLKYIFLSISLFITKIDGAFHLERHFTGNI